MIRNLQPFIAVILCISFCCAIVLCVAQAPQLLNYQTVLRDTAGNPLAPDTRVSLYFKIHDGTPMGNVIFSEVDSATTDRVGMVQIQIGSTNSLSAVNWNSGSKYLEVLLEGTNTLDYTSMGVAQLISVPYALYAANSLGGMVGPTGPTGPAQGSQGPTGPNGESGAGVIELTVRGSTDASVPQSFDTAVVYYTAPQMQITYLPHDSNALVTFAASGSYYAVLPTDAQWISARILVNGAFQPGQAGSWLVGASVQGQSFNTVWGVSLTVPVKVAIGLPTTILIQWSYTTGYTGQFNFLENDVLSDPAQTSFRTLSILEYN